jgi:hypothetical protein
MEDALCLGTFFYGLFYGREKFCCKTVQFTATLCECWIAERPSVRNAVLHCENERKNSFLNYESPALTAELQARFHRQTSTAKKRLPSVFAMRKHSHSLSRLNRQRASLLESDQGKSPTGYVVHFKRSTSLRKIYAVVGAQRP